MLSQVFVMTSTFKDALAKGKGSTQICPQQNSTVTFNSDHGTTEKCQKIWKYQSKPSKGNNN